jgi:hypothetical protein
VKGENSMEFGVWSLVPPVLTIALALTTKNVFISLLIGILTGNLVLNHFAVFTGLNAGIYSILDTMTESNTLIIGSVLITAAVIHLAEKSPQEIEDIVKLNEAITAADVTMRTDEIKRELMKKG